MIYSFWYSSTRSSEKKWGKNSTRPSTRKKYWVFTTGTTSLNFLESKGVIPQVGRLMILKSFGPQRMRVVCSRRLQLVHPLLVRYTAQTSNTPWYIQSTRRVTMSWYECPVSGFSFLPKSLSFLLSPLPPTPQVVIPPHTFYFQRRATVASKKKKSAGDC